MWQFLKRQQRDKQTESTEQPRKPLAFDEIIAGMGDFSDFADNDAALKIWLPKPAEQALCEMSERSHLSVSGFLRQYLAIHCYGLYAFYQMTEAMPTLFKEPYYGNADVKYSMVMEDPPEDKKRVDTYWVIELGKNIAPVKVWIPKRMKTDLQILAEHVGLTPSNYVREVLISRLLGHGMLPQRPAMFKPFPAPEADAWEADQQVWREVSQEEFHSYHIGEIRTEWVDED